MFQRKTINSESHHLTDRRRKCHEKGKQKSHTHGKKKKTIKIGRPMGIGDVSAFIFHTIQHNADNNNNKTARKTKNLIEKYSIYNNFVCILLTEAKAAFGRISLRKL